LKLVYCETIQYSYGAFQGLDLFILHNCTIEWDSVPELDIMIIKIQS